MEQLRIFAVLDCNGPDCTDEVHRPGCQLYRRPRAYDSTCPTCLKNGGFGPPHDPSPYCESGGHTHCTCDRCF